MDFFIWGSIGFIVVCVIIGFLRRDEAGGGSENCDIYGDSSCAHGGCM